jgi:hypothetical protein
MKTHKLFSSDVFQYDDVNRLTEITTFNTTNIFIATKIECYERLFLLFFYWIMYVFL